MLQSIARADRYNWQFIPIRPRSKWRSSATDRGKPKYGIGYRDNKEQTSWKMIYVFGLYIYIYIHLHYLFFFSYSTARANSSQNAVDLASTAGCGTPKLVHVVGIPDEFETYTLLLFCGYLGAGFGISATFLVVRRRRRCDTTNHSCFCCFEQATRGIERKQGIIWQIFPGVRQIV